MKNKGMSYYQKGLDFKPKSIGRNGSVIRDNDGYWNPDNWGHPVEINSNQITMKGVTQPLIGVSDTGDIQYMQPGGEYRFDGKKVTEFPINSLSFDSGENINGMKKKIKKGQYGLIEGISSVANSSKTPNINSLFSPQMYGDNFDVSKIRESVGMVPQAGEIGKSQGGFDFNKAIGTATPIAKGLIEGFQMMKDQKEQLRRTQQWKGVSDVVLQASETRPEEVERRYVRPEDISLTGEELFPIYGTGTNVLKNGGSVKNKAQFGNIMSTFASSGGGDALSGIYRGFRGESGGGKIGGTIGGVAGSIFGPVGSMVGQVGGEIIGELLDKKAEKIEAAQKATDKNLTRIGINAGVQGLQRHNYSVMDNGGNISSLDGDIIPLWGGKAETLSVNPYLPDGGETIMFKGQSHKDGGIGVKFGGTAVEVEGGEPALKLEHGSSGKDNLVVYGNIKINNEFSSLLGDPDAKGKKFKNYVADLSKQEEKSAKILDSSMEKLDEMEVITPFDKLKMSSMEANITGSNMTLKDIANKKINAASLQQAINQDEEEKKLKITNNGDVKKAKNGISIGQNGLEIVSDEDYAYLVELYNQARNQGTGDVVEKFQREFSRLAPNRAKKVLADYPVTNYGKARNMSNEELQSNYDSIFGKRTKRYIPEKARELSDLGVTPINPDYSSLPANTEVISQFPETEYNRSALLDAVGQILPFVRPSDAESLDPRQLAGEMFALSSNQLEPVKAQRYAPQLGTPYDISFQDILNENRIENQSAQRLYGYNPAVQSLLSAQGYQANQSVLGEQFRANQAMRDQVFGQNRNLLNDAQLKNLEILDNQYQRQSQAASNTKAISQAAVSSIADKYLQNQLENRTLQAYENMYNYRFDKRGRAINMNAPHQFDIPQVGTYDPYEEVDDDGNVITTTERTRVSRDAFGKPKGSTYTSETKNKKSYKNGSIVKYVHDL